MFRYRPRLRDIYAVGRHGLKMAANITLACALVTTLVALSYLRSAYLCGLKAS